MLLFGTIKTDPVRELFDYIIKEGKANEFGDYSNNFNDQVSIIID